jgi:hypothetical protein
MEESWYSSQDRYGFLCSLLLVALRKVSHRYFFLPCLGPVALVAHGRAQSTGILFAGFVFIF